MGRDLLRRRATGSRVAAGLLALAMLAPTGCRSGREQMVGGPLDTLSRLEIESEPAPATTALTDPPPAPTPTAAPAPKPAPAPGGAKLGPGPAPPPTPAALGAELARVEVALRDPATPAAEIPALGLAQQVGVRQLANYPAWRPAVLEAVPANVRAAVVANADAELRLASMHARRPTTFPKWRIVPPPPTGEVLAAHKAAAAEIGVPWPVLASIHLVETRMGRIRGISTAGARGPMQFLPGTWAQYGAGGDIEDLQDASKAAARLLKRNGINGNPRNAVFNYNRSNAYVDAVLAYAAVMDGDPQAFLGYHGWQVFYRHAQGDTLLPEGWSGV